MTIGISPYFRVPTNLFRLSPKLLIKSAEKNSAPFFGLLHDKSAAQTETEFHVERLASFDEYLEQDRYLGAKSQRNIFQQVDFLQSWFASFGQKDNVEPLLLRVLEVSTGRLIMLLPLIVLTIQRVRIIEFADLGSIDYNGPVLSNFAPKDPITSQNLWRAIKRALPEADMIRLEKMPFKIGDQINPFILCHGKRDCQFFGQKFDTGGDWDSYIRTRNPKFAKDTRRRRRRLGELGKVEFRPVTCNEEAETCLIELNRMQKDRLEEVGRSHDIDDPAYQSFYRRMLIENIQNGKVRLFSLCVDDKIVALLYGICMGEEFSILRITHAGKDWNNSSPGRLIIVEAVKLLENEGFRVFDLTIGDYYFKDRFRPEKYQLYSLTEALSPIGKMVLLGNRFRSFFKQNLNQICNLSKSVSTK